ncbi:OmpA family protein [Salipiger mucosus]|uniref:OmpA domain protein n=1 Tax=Salipiger mucosus DSM 16094 TaxID=1123237 RepID=S9SKS6_9RHOB|nr:OmpA family protein [Salipiger mucosus]EPX86974.1 OmpA domain protein [Salipiger mucosus DSM 16094]
MLLWATPLPALDLSLPEGARLTAESVTDPDSYAMPTGPWRVDAGIPTRAVEGRILRQAWRIEATGLTPLQILGPLREQVTEAGWEVLLDCADQACGGFDFRFGTEVMQAPEMYVDLTDYRFLSAQGPDGAYISLLVSRSETAGHVQVIRAGGTEAEEAEVEADAPPVESPPTGDLARRLEAEGHVVLTDLTFSSGSAALAEDAIGSLDALADYLGANPERRIVFVGHTDAVGSLEANRALSRERAAAAVAYLRERGVPDGQIDAEGVGYLAPEATNLTEEGREANRRVEAVLIDGE